MAGVVQSPFYVTRPPFIPPWVKSRPSNTVLGTDFRLFLVPAPTLVVPSPPRPIVWIGEPVANTLVLAPTGTPKGKLWRYDFVPQGNWTGRPNGSWLIRLLTNTKFFGALGQVPTKRWKYDPDLNPKIWEGSPLPSFTVYLPGSGTPIIPRMWRWDNVPNPVWTWEPPPAWSNYIPQTNPFFKLWRSDYVPNPVWTWEASPALANYLPQVTTLPFSKLWRYDYQNPLTWNWQPPPTLAPKIGTPFSKLWRYDYVTPPVWSWSGTSAESAYIPITLPFSKLWRYDYVPTPSWTWSGTKSAYLPVTNPFYKLWRSDYVPPPDWTWKAPRSYRIYMPTVVTFYGAQGQAPTKQWLYNYVPSPVWQGKPLKSIGIGNVPVIPAPTVEVEEGKVFKFERRKIFKSRLPVMSRFKR